MQKTLHYKIYIPIYNWQEVLNTLCYKSGHCFLTEVVLEVQTAVVHLHLNIQNILYLPLACMSIIILLFIKQMTKIASG